MDTKRLKQLISKFPRQPGIYIFTGPSGEKLYIGKASNIKARLSSYLKTADQRILQMLSQASTVKTVETGSEIEALILESQYIKKYKPAFNIMLRDDKQFFYVVLTKEIFPKIFLTHQPNSKYRNVEISHFVGPFTDGTALKTTLRYLRRIFPYCTCKQLHNNYCLNYHIGKCPGFCCLKNPDLKTSPQSPANTQRSLCIGRYRRDIVAIKDILSGKKNSLIKKLEKEMVALGKKERFKEAIELRDKIEKIKRVFENAKIIIRINESYPNAPNRNHYDTSKYHSGTARDLKKVLGLKKIPARIEGYDVANIQGKYAVGAMVVFENGIPDKNEYRKFKIYTKQTADDTAMLKEILKRRFNHHEWPMPDLILVDGGKAQLNAAKVVGRKQRAVRIIALTKNEKHRGEKIYVAGRSNLIPLSQLPVSVKNLLLNVDAEAHRFAIGYYRQLHRRAIN